MASAVTAQAARGEYASQNDYRYSAPTVESDGEFRGMLDPKSADISSFPRRQTSFPSGPVVGEAKGIIQNENEQRLNVKVEPRGPLPSYSQCKLCSAMPLHSSPSSFR
jgi:hypothetical protein